MYSFCKPETQTKHMGTTNKKTHKIEFKRKKSNNQIKKKILIFYIISIEASKRRMLDLILCKQ